LQDVESILAKVRGYSADSPVPSDEDSVLDKLNDLRFREKEKMKAVEEQMSEQEKKMISVNRQTSKNFQEETEANCIAPFCDIKATTWSGYCSHHSRHTPSTNKSYYTYFQDPQNQKDIKIDQKLHALFNKFSGDSKTMNQELWCDLCKTVVNDTTMTLVDVELTYRSIKPRHSNLVSFMHVCMGILQLAIKKYPKKDNALHYMIKNDFNKF